MPAPEPDHDRRARRWRIGTTAAGVLLLVSPAIRDHDSFPLSTYPVYASVRPSTADFGTAFGERADGTERRLSMDVIAETDDPLIAADRVRDAIAAGGAMDLCERIAARAPADVAAVVVATERHDLVAAARGGASRLERTVHARCTARP